jgi:hypothetical protein
LHEAKPTGALESTKVMGKNDQKRSQPNPTEAKLGGGEDLISLLESADRKMTRESKPKANPTKATQQAQPRQIGLRQWSRHQAHILHSASRGQIACGDTKVYSVEVQGKIC